MSFVLRRVAGSLLASAFLAGSAAALSDPAGVVRWGGRDFSDPASLASWLQARGLDYGRWAANHPAAAARLEGRDAEQSAPVPAPPSSPPKVEADPPIPDERDSLRTVLLIGVLGACSASLLIAAAIPPQVLAHLGVPTTVDERRPEIAAAGAALALAVGVAYLL